MISSVHAGAFDPNCTEKKGENAANFNEDAARTFINKCFKNSKTKKYDIETNENCYNAFVKKRCTDLGNTICLELFQDTDLPRYNSEKPVEDKRAEAEKKAAEEKALKEEEQKKKIAEQKKIEAQESKKRQEEDHKAFLNSGTRSNTTGHQEVQPD